jgi:hypothetical protein
MPWIKDEFAYEPDEAGWLHKFLADHADAHDGDAVSARIYHLAQARSCFGDVDGAEAVLEELGRFPQYREAAQAEMRHLLLVRNDNLPGPNVLSITVESLARRHEVLESSRELTRQLSGYACRACAQALEEMPL